MNLAEPAMVEAVSCYDLESIFWEFHDFLPPLITCLLAHCSRKQSRPNLTSLLLRGGFHSYIMPFPS